MDPIPHNYRSPWLHAPVFIQSKVEEFLLLRLLRVCTYVCH